MREAIRHLKNRKSGGIHGVVNVMMESGGGTFVEVIWKEYDMEKWSGT